MSAYRTPGAGPEPVRGYELILAPGDGFTSPRVSRAFRWRWLAWVMMMVWRITHPYGFARFRRGDEPASWSPR